ncbi:hypothetical protein CEXT_413241 [Caerostris extrusa]|uniref:Uncharacterized protein n=1 Tax=Caerostris extrusa TaxID=172846 RepID=A0AAV4N166_CAEEX|nr:hypothetical protein CEXT_413241 [Caerostris extrusa]
MIQKESTSGISFDLNNMEFLQSNEDQKICSKNFVTNKSPITMKNKDSDIAFLESAIAENIFFDISFDCPDLETLPNQEDFSEKIVNDAVCENVGSNTSKDISSHFTDKKNLVDTKTCLSKDQNISLVINNNILQKSSNNKSFCNEIPKPEIKSVIPKMAVNDISKESMLTIDKYVKTNLEISDTEDF